MNFKAGENFMAAKMLIDGALYSASIHCLYYSCFQLSKFALCKTGVTYDKQEVLSKGRDSHHYVINETAKFLSDSHLDFLDYNSNMNQLKRIRRKADYKEDRITKIEAEKACSMADNVRSIINAHI